MSFVDNGTQRKRYWFQDQGFFDTVLQQWMPYYPLPKELIVPGTQNWVHRSDIFQPEVESTARYIDRVLYPRLTKSMRMQFIERRRRSLRKFRDVLWRRLEPIKNFDGQTLISRYNVNDEFRVDKYGNVLARRAKRFSRTSFDVDHIFPYSRGGLSQLQNLRIIHQRANSVVKGDRVEFTIDPFQMRTGISEAQFIDFFLNTFNKNFVGFYKFMTEPQSFIRQEIQYHDTRNKLDREFYLFTCDFCTSKKATLVCNSCLEWQYCSNECAQKHWIKPDSLHRSQCFSFSQKIKRKKTSNIK